MMEALKRQLTQAGLDADTLHAEYRRDVGAADDARFVAYLQERGVIAAATGDAQATGYTLLERLGEGAMGEVHLARDAALKRKVAFKRMAAQAAASPHLRARFLAEVQVTAQLDHPNIVPIYGLELAPDGTPGYAMKLVEGRTLADVLEDARRAAPREPVAHERTALLARLEIFLKVCDAVAFAHAKGVLHRDLKPDNVMIGRFNQVYVVDWGIARVIGTPDRAAEVETVAREGTQAGALLGTPAYMSPEQAMGKVDALDARSDVCALGLILFELVSLRPARRAASLEAAIVRAAQAENDRLVHADRRVRIPRELRAIVARATALEPSARYASVNALAEDVRRYLRGEAVRARPDGPLQAAARLVGRYRMGVLVAVLLALLAAAGAAIGLLEAGRAAVQAAERRESFHAQVAELAHALDARLQRHAVELEGLAAHVAEVLTRGTPPETPVYLAADFDDPARRPSDMEVSPRYGHLLSPSWPVFVLPPSVSREAALGEMRALSLSRGVMGRLVGKSEGAVHRVTVTLAGGVHAALPGWGGYLEGYDGRTRPRYRLAANGRTLAWGDPVRALDGQPMLPVATPVMSDDGRFLGVAGLDVSLRGLERMITPPAALGARRAFIVDDEGGVVASSEGLAIPPADGAEAPGDRHAEGELALEPLPYPEVVEAIRAGRSGHARSGGELVVYSALPATGMYYVVVAPDPH